MERRCRDATIAACSLVAIDRRCRDVTIAPCSLVEIERRCRDATIAACSLVAVDRRCRDVTIRAVMMEALRTSESSVYVSKTTRLYIPEGRHLQNIHGLCLTTCKFYASKDDVAVPGCDAV
jgi:hypothetical protein